MGLVKIKDDSEFWWGAEQQKDFDNIKEYLSSPSVLVPPQQGKSFYVYLSLGDTSIAPILIQLHDGQEKVIFYLNRRILDAEQGTLRLKNCASVYTLHPPSCDTFCSLRKRS